MEDETMTNEQFWEAIRNAKYETYDTMITEIEEHPGITTEEIILMLKAHKKELSHATNET